MRGRDACISRISRISRISQIYGCVTVYPEVLLCRSVEWLGRRCAAGVMQRADLPPGSAGLFDGCGGMRVAVAWRLHKTYKTYKTYKMMMGGASVYQRVCLPQCGMARAMIYRWGMPGFFDGCGGVRVAVAWHNKNGNERKRTETNGEKGVPRYTPRVCCAAVWNGSGEDVPQG